MNYKFEIVKPEEYFNLYKDEYTEMNNNKELWKEEALRNSEAWKYCRKLVEELFIGIEGNKKFIS